MDTGLQTQREEARADLNLGKFGKGPAVGLNVSLAKYIHTNVLLHPHSRRAKDKFYKNTPI